MRSESLALHIAALAKRVVCSGLGVPRDEALELALSPRDADPWLVAAANQTRLHFKGREIRLCSIVNAKSGSCGEDCAFCAQSSKSAADIESYPLRENEWLIEQARKAAAGGAGEFSVVTSGRKVSGGDLERIAEVVTEVGRLGLEPCASLGVLSKEELVGLRGAGLRVFHHNLETARSNYHKIVSTRDYDTNVACVAAAREAGLEICCGGIFGLGEDWAQRIELLADLAKLEVDRIPLNFLIPIEGTRLAGRPLLDPMDALRIICLARLMLPAREIVVAGGRERVLGQLQSQVFFAGANGILTGNYLTTKGRCVQDDLELVRACGLMAMGGR